MGRQGKGLKPNKEKLIEFYITQSKSIREISTILGCSKDMVYRTLQEYGIKRRSRIRQSKLRKYTISYLEKGVREKGIRGFARELGVDESTLRHHLKVRRHP